LTIFDPATRRVRDALAKRGLLMWLRSALSYRPGGRHLIGITRIMSVMIGGGSGEGAQVRLAELVAALSLGVDLGFGQPMEHVLRQSLIALRLAERLGLDDDNRVIVYYTALLVNVGCHSDAHEQAKWFGDDITLKGTKYEHEQRSLAYAAATMRLFGSGDPPLHRFRVGLEFALAGYRDIDGMIARHAAMARSFAEQLGLPDAVQEAVGASYEQWDGHGWPGNLKGDAVPLASRLAQLAEYVEVAHRLGGVEAATEMARKRAGGQFDPALSALLCDDPEAILGGLESARTWAEVIAAEPALGVRLSQEQFDAALVAIADFVDLKSPYTLGHARAVANLAAGAGAHLGMAAEDLRTLRRAGLIQGLGRLGVSNSIWDKHGPLGAGEWERVRMQPYLTDRMLQQSPSLAPLGAIAVQFRERLDGSGYPRGLSGAAITRPARILGAADAYQSMTEPRPHRPALAPADAATQLRAEVKAGRLDRDAVEAVLAAAGHRVPRRREGPAGLTAREVDVLRLVAQGLSSREIAARLVISPKTARNHIEHIYTKIGASSRATASLFAMQQGLLSDEYPVPA
jgi:HD-GYP domain-containing protein (c-di-GMP phosphodiesterase class II)